MNRFAMIEGGREHDFAVVSAKIELLKPGHDESCCKIQVIAKYREQDQDAVLWFALKGIPDFPFTMREEIVPPDSGGLYFYEHSPLENLDLTLTLEKQTWRLDVSCQLFSMGNESQTINVSADLEPTADLELLS